MVGTTITESRWSVGRRVVPVLVTAVLCACSHVSSTGTGSSGEESFSDAAADQPACQPDRDVYREVDPAGPAEGENPAQAAEAFLRESEPDLAWDEVREVARDELATVQATQAGAIVAELRVQPIDDGWTAVELVVCTR